jgi:hypothetical protein
MTGRRAVAGGGEHREGLVRAAPPRVRALLPENPQAEPSEVAQ